jgi:cytochrome c oxidase subunit 1
VTLATLWTVAAQLLFVFNFASTLLRRRQLEEDNPWHASTLEWSIASPAPAVNFGDALPTVYRGAYEFPAGFSNDFAPQHLAPELLGQKAR